MKIVVEEQQQLQDMELHILCEHRDEKVEQLISLITGIDSTLSATDMEGRTQLIKIKEVLYFESVDKKTYAYQSETVYEIKFRLYELESVLPQMKYIRISKSIIINISAVEMIEPEEGRRLKVKLMNGERVLISRMYVKEFKNRIGIR
jgi:DNA-binding LytR/AlgR family response regulator